MLPEKNAEKNLDCGLEFVTANGNSCLHLLTKSWISSRNNLTWWQHSLFVLQYRESSYNLLTTVDDWGLLPRRHTWVHTLKKWIVNLKVSVNFCLIKGFKSRTCKCGVLCSCTCTKALGLGGDSGEEHTVILLNLPASYIISPNFMRKSCDLHEILRKNG